MLPVLNSISESQYLRLDLDILESGGGIFLYQSFGTYLLYRTIGTMSSFFSMKILLSLKVLTAKHYKDFTVFTILKDVLISWFTMKFCKESCCCYKAVALLIPESWFTHDGG
jgi:hypothetical protein